jgi:transcription initiation factor TFIIIB Brf1 subunit/transcription initiation factor TFIIB
LSVLSGPFDYESRISYCCSIGKSNPWSLSISAISSGETVAECCSAISELSLIRRGGGDWRQTDANQKHKHEQGATLHSNTYGDTLNTLQPDI